MIGDFINAFHNAQLKLANETDFWEDDRFKALDREVERAFNDILAFQPATRSEFSAVSSFLLEILTRNDDGSNSRILTRLGELVQIMSDKI